MSYKYEVEDSLIAGSDQTKNLNAHQRQIIDWIVESKVEAIICGVCLLD